MDTLLPQVMPVLFSTISATVEIQPYTPSMYCMRGFIFSMLVQSENLTVSHGTSSPANYNVPHESTAPVAMRMPHLPITATTKTADPSVMKSESPTSPVRSKPSPVSEPTANNQPQAIQESPIQPGKRDQTSAESCPDQIFELSTFISSYGSSAP